MRIKVNPGMAWSDSLKTVEGVVLISALRVPPHSRSTQVEEAGPMDTRPTLLTQGMTSQSALHAVLPVMELRGVWPWVLPDSVKECVRLLTAQGKGLVRLSYGRC